MMSYDASPPAEKLGEIAPSERATNLADRMLTRVGHAASVDAVFGAPVTAHGRTVIPVARTYFALGGGGGEGSGRAPVRESGQLRMGGGGGGAGCTFASGYIELSAEGTRYIAVSNTRDRLLGGVIGLLLALVLIRVFRR